MVQTQTFGNGRTGTEQSNKLKGLQLDAHTLHKLKEQALKKARILQAKVGTCNVMLPRNLSLPMPSSLPHVACLN